MGIVINSQPDRQTHMKVCVQGGKGVGLTEAGDAIKVKGASGLSVREGIVFPLRSHLSLSMFT